MPNRKPSPSKPGLAGPTLADIRVARERVSAVVDTTPMEKSRFLRELLGQDVYLKAENLQRTGSYKIRGAYNLLAQLSSEQRAAGVVAASAGNHAQGVALAARELGIAATIFMPLGVALPKLQATRNYGAEVVRVEPPTGRRSGGGHARHSRASHRLWGMRRVPAWRHSCLRAAWALWD